MSKEQEAALLTFDRISDTLHAWPRIALVRLPRGGTRCLNDRRLAV